MGERIDEQTDGRLRIRVYHAGQLGRESDTVDLARFGALDITRVNFAPLNNAFPPTRVFSLPYVFDSVEHMRRAVGRRSRARRCSSSFEQRELVGLAIYDAGSRSLLQRAPPGARARRPARPEDPRAAVGHLHRAASRALGANPTPLPFGEVYSALQTHLIEGAENNWRTFHTSRQFEVARYWSQTDHSYSPEALLLSKRTYDALSPRDREIVRRQRRARACRTCASCGTRWKRSRARTCSRPACRANEVEHAGVPPRRRADARALSRETRTCASCIDGIRALA